jgi:hypothetical protein
VFSGISGDREREREREEREREREREREGRKEGGRSRSAPARRPQTHLEAESRRTDDPGKGLPPFPGAGNSAGGSTPPAIMSLRYLRIVIVRFRVW